jgi:hypothetical protein
VEEKNGSIVRRLVGYDRYEGMDAQCALAQLYSVLRLYVNFFQPSMKLVSKKRNAAKVTKKYDKAKTPYQRLLLSSQITPEVKVALKKQYHSLDPLHLLKELERLQDVFWRHAWKSEDKCAATTLPAQHDKDTDLTVMANSISRGATELPTTTGETPVVDRYYRKTHKPRKRRGERTWRTHKDPFEKVWEKIRTDLSVSPHLTAKGLLDGLIQKEPDHYNASQLRILQRRVNAWRLEQANQEQHYQMISS